MPLGTAIWWSLSNRVYYCLSNGIKKIPVGGTEARKLIRGESPLVCLEILHHQLQYDRFSRASPVISVVCLKCLIYGVAFACLLSPVTAAICTGCCKSLIWWRFTFHLLLLTIHCLLFVFFLLLLATYPINSFIQSWEQDHHRSFPIQNPSLKQKAEKSLCSQIKHYLEEKGTENVPDKISIPQWGSINTTDHSAKNCLPSVDLWYLSLIWGAWR